MEQNAEAGQSEEAPKKKSTLVRDLIVGTVALGFGFGTGVAVPMFASSEDTQSSAEDGQSESGVRSTKLMDIPPADDELAFIEFDEVIVNLNDSRYSRFLNCKFSLQVAGSQQLAIEELVTKKSVLLKNWLISHLRDKELDSVKGMLGQNTLRREIHAKFNEILFTDGVERIQDVLFQDLKVQ